MCTDRTQDLVSFHDAEELGQEFKQLLQRHKIIISDTSELGIACNAMTAILLKHWDSTLRDPKADVRQEFQDALALHAFLSNTLAAEAHDNFAPVLEHITEMAAKGGVRQNQWTSTLDRLAPKIFELLIALAVMRIGTNVQLDHPTKSSKGKNPDVIATINGARWGIACKMLNTPAPGSPTKTLGYLDNIKDGVRQINNANLDHGLVIISRKNLIDHDRAWPLLNPEAFKRGAEPEYDAFQTAQEVTDQLAADARALHQAMLDEIGEENVRALFKNSKARPFALQHIHTVAAVTCCEKTMATPLNFLFQEIGTWWHRRPRPPENEPSARSWLSPSRGP
jgi:hypothetical protein